MRATAFKPIWQGGWAIGLAVLSLVVPMAAFFLGNEPIVPFADPARVSYYRQTVAALGVGLACAAGAFVGTRSQTSALARWLTVIPASLGLLFIAYLLWALIGTCGVGVLWGRCNP